PADPENTVSRVPSSSTTSSLAFLEPILDELDSAKDWSYSTGSEPAAEPTAWASLALRAHGRDASADRAARWLAELQAADGTVGISRTQREPHWPTSLAVLAWCAAAKESSTPFAENIARATRWIDNITGKPAPRTEDLGHDTTLIGWPWVENTHSWAEPTAFSVLALKAAGQRDHPRTREAIGLLIDRLLPEGGANYGNTYVLGQLLRPHLEPTGVVLAALVDEEDDSSRIQKSLDYASAAIGPSTTAVSLAFVLMGLAAHDRTPADAEKWLAGATEVTRRLVGYQGRLPLIALAAAGDRSPVIELTRKRKAL
ncbi:MAG TPA: hypothetical protein VHV77_02390, partial [Pirellulales bacterium]|nr:hypothetical protein [Pirellulales bacterium]